MSCFDISYSSTANPSRLTYSKTVALFGSGTRAHRSSFVKFAARAATEGSSSVSLNGSRMFLAMLGTFVGSRYLVQSGGSGARGG